VYPLRR